MRGAFFSIAIWCLTLGSLPATTSAFIPSFSSSSRATLSRFPTRVVSPMTKTSGLGMGEMAPCTGRQDHGDSGQEPKVGVIVVDHGSRRKEANNALNGVVDRFREMSGFSVVEPAHMELAEPSIATAYGRCIEQGATYIICHPFFLSKGRHVVEDIPALMQQASAMYPGTKWSISEPLGLQAAIPLLMSQSVIECWDKVNKADTTTMEPAPTL